MTTPRSSAALAALLLGGLAAVASAAERANRPAGVPGVRVVRDLEYVPSGGKSRSLDLYLPEKADAPRPLIVWIHGGAWLGGDKAGCPAARMVARGYAAASINYRLSQAAVFPAQIEDCKAAIRWLRAHAKEYQIDPDHIGVWGSSAGGHLVALLGTAGDVKEFDAQGGNAETSSRVQAVCDWFGPTDLVQMGAQAGPNSAIKHDAPNSPEALLIGGAIQENKEKAARANPIRYVTQDDPPFLIMHGDRDNMVPHQQSVLLAEALKKAGVEVTFKTIAGAGHGGPQFNTPENTKLVEEFFDKSLKGAGR